MDHTVSVPAILSPEEVIAIFNTKLPVSRTFKAGMWEYSGTKNTVEVAKEPRKGRGRNTKEG